MLGILVIGNIFYLRVVPVQIYTGTKGQINGAGEESMAIGYKRRNRNSEHYAPIGL